MTGGLGFIGSAFIRLVLKERPAVQVVNLDAVTYAGNSANLREIDGDSRYRFVRGNICDAGAVGDAIGDGVDAIVNFAAETHVDRSILEPEAFLRTDILGTHVLLEAVRERGSAATSRSPPTKSTATSPMENRANPTRCARAVRTAPARPAAICRCSRTWRRSRRRC